jgi:rieske iron-sulfur protein
MPAPLPVSRPCRCSASADAANCHGERPRLARRALLNGGLAAGLALPFAETALANDPKAARPQRGDLFVYVRGDKAGSVIAPADVQVGGVPLFAWPMEPSTKTIRDGSRLNQILLVRLDADALDDKTRERAADGVVAYSANCTHALCPVTGWKAERQILWCPCHNSEFDPRHAGDVVFGPAPRALPALPLKIADGALAAAGTFLGRVGHST